MNDNAYIIPERQEAIDELMAEFFPAKLEATTSTSQDGGDRDDDPDRDRGPADPAMEDDKIVEWVLADAKSQRLWAGNTSDYGSASEADLGLMNRLAECSRDPDQLERVFDRSGLARRDKWTQRADYRRNLVATALAGGVVPVTTDAGDVADADVDDLPDLPIMRLPEFIANVPDEPDWFMRMLVAAGVSTIGFAPYKAGKSLLLWGFLRAAEHGDVTFLSHEIKGDFKVLFLTEEGGFTVRDKYFDLDLKGEAIDILSSRERGVGGVPWSKLWPAVLREARRENYQLIVVDTVSTWCGLDGETENQAGAVTEAIRPFKEACEEAGIAVVFLHHARKEGGSHGKAIRGSTQFLALVDSYFELSYLGPDKNSPRKLTITSRFIEDSEPVAYTYSEGEFDWTADIDSVTETKTSRRGDVLEAVRQGAQTADEVADAVGISPYTTRKHLVALHKRKQLKRSGRGSGDSPYRFEVAG